MVYFTTLYCWLTLGATTVNIPYQKHTHNHSKPDGGNFLYGGENRHKFQKNYKTS